MIYTLDNIKRDFVKSLNEVIDFIEFINLSKTQDVEFARKSKYYGPINDSLNEIKEKINDTKDIQYNAIIISLYGSFELAIKEATKAFLKFSINKNFPLANRLSKDYILSVAKTFDRNSISESRNNIKDLNAFLNENDMSKFNSELALLNYQNLKTGNVQKIANSIEINNILEEIKGLEEFEKYIMVREGLSSIEQATYCIKKLTNPFQYVDDLVENRNHIAHRGRAESRFDFKIVKDCVISELKIIVFYYLKRVKEVWYCNCVHNNTDIEELEVSQIYDNKIICFNTKDIVINKNSVILVKNGKNQIKVATINTVRDSVGEIEVSEKNQDISCSLTTTCKNTFSYYLYNPKQN